MASEWEAWHRQYDSASPLAQRLQAVRTLIRAAIERTPSGPWRAVSLCAGDGRDLLGVLENHPRGRDARARLVDLDPKLVEAGRERARLAGLEGVEFRVADAGDASALDGAVPADLVLACGIFGNVSNEDILNTVTHLPELCAPGSTVVWTRGRFEPDLTPTIRGWFRDSGFEEVAFVAIPDSTATAVAHRLVVPPRPYRRDVRLFTFLPAGERPADRARQSG